MNTQSNWLIDTIFSVDCRILRIAEFDLKILDYHFKLQNPNSASWWKIQVDSIFTEQLVLSQKTEWKA